MTCWIYLCQWCHRLYDAIRNRKEVAKKFLQDENLWGVHNESN